MWNNSCVDDFLDLLVAAVGQVGDGPAGVGCRKITGWVYLFKFVGLVKNRDRLFSLKNLMRNILVGGVIIIMFQVWYNPKKSQNFCQNTITIPPL